MPKPIPWKKPNVKANRFVLDINTVENDPIHISEAPKSPPSLKEHLLDIVLRIKPENNNI